MRKDTYQERRLAVHRFLNGESPEAICASLGHSRSWLYKWVERCLQGNPSWYESQSRRPLNNALQNSGFSKKAASAAASAEKTRTGAISRSQIYTK